MLTTEPLEVRVGNGRRSHLFIAAPGANAKRMSLQDGDTAYDYVLCGASGALTLADDGLELCRTCETLRDRRDE